MKSDEMSPMILKVLYDAWFDSDGDANLNHLSKEKGWDKNNFDKIEHRLCSDGFIAPSSIITQAITPAGILYAEQNHIASEEQIKINSDVREKLLHALYQLYEENGPDSQKHYSILIGL